MRYYKATELNNRALVQWNHWANSIEELTAMGEETNPLIVAEDQIAFAFGVSTVKIVSGALVALTQGELDSAEAEFSARSAVSFEATKINAVNAASFTHGAKIFPMNEAARLRYLAVAMMAVKGDTEFMTTAGSVWTVLQADIPAFTEAYFTKLRVLTDLVIT